MDRFTVSNPTILLNDLFLTSIQDDASDSSVLEFMAQRLSQILQELEQPQRVQLPIIKHTVEGRQCMQRTIIYQPHELFSAKKRHFVGFIGKKQPLLALPVQEAIAEIDKKLIVELSQNAYLLSYSSLALEDGNWYNLVVFKDQQAKRYFHESSTHCYAAHQLASNYYEWIRIHNGDIALKGEHNDLTFLKTTYYEFLPAQTEPAIQRKVYDPVGQTIG